MKTETITREVYERDLKAMQAARDRWRERAELAEERLQKIVSIALSREG